MAAFSVKLSTSNISQFSVFYPVNYLNLLDNHVSPYKSHHKGLPTKTCYSNNSYKIAAFISFTQCRGLIQQFK